MKILGMAFLMTFGTAFASTNFYDLKMDILINGKHSFSPRILVKEGQVGSFTQKNISTGEESFIDVVASKSMIKDINNGVLMKFTIGTIDKNGTKHIIGQPQVIAKENQQAKITEGTTRNGSEVLSLSVIATKRIQ